MLSRELLDDDYCQGVAFEVTDRDALARAIALVLIQEYRLATALLSSAPVDDELPALERGDIEDIVNRRLKPNDVYHRDGFLFQLVMWLAAHLDLEPGDLVALPHSQGSAKGQDSILVHRKDGAVIALSICEDKATENPRHTVRDGVWPEIEEYEHGGRRDELRSNVIATLGLGGIPMEEAARLVRRIAWEGARRYRVRVTLQEKRRKTLFKGFETVAPGGQGRRRGETVLLPELRDWMSGLAELVERELRTYIQEE